MRQLNRFPFPDHDLYFEKEARERAAEILCFELKSSINIEEHIAATKPPAVLIPILREQYPIALRRKKEANEKQHMKKVSNPFSEELDFGVDLEAISASVSFSLAVAPGKLSSQLAEAVSKLEWDFDQEDSDSE